ncbi:MAG: response regulator [bacterium]
MKNEELIIKLREAFQAEAKERLASISSGMLKLEKNTEPEEQKSVIEMIFREAHNMKGAARAVNMGDIETIFQSIESVFSNIKKGKVPLSPELFDTLHASISTVKNIIAASFENQSPGNVEDTPTVIRQLEDLKYCKEYSVSDDNKETRKDKTKEKKVKEKISTLPVTQKNVAAGPKTYPIKKDTREAKPETHPIKENTINTKSETHPINKKKIETKPKRMLSTEKAPETIRLPKSRIDSLLLKVEEMVSMKLMLSQQLVNLGDLGQLYAHWEKINSTAHSEFRGLKTQLQNEDDSHDLSQSRSKMIDLLEFIHWNHDHIQSLGREIKTLTKSAKQDHRLFSKMVDDLLDDIKKVTMLPFSTLLEIFPQIVRDISRQQGKEVEIKIQGETIEIDRRILEEMKDPLIHILRNSLDHGIENPHERLEKQKPSCGVIDLIITQNEGNKIEILFSDDGRGIDLEKVKTKAIQLGIISKKEASRMGEQEAIQLAFHSELSTSPIITQISGRGLGLAIVHEKVEKLGGVLSVENLPGKGCLFRMQLPVTLATFRGVLIKVADNLFITPTSHVQRVLRVKKNEVKTVKNRATISLNGKIISLVNMADILHLSAPKKERKNSIFITALVLGAGEKYIAFKVDEIVSEHEILIKGLGKQLRRVPNIAGATILGTGIVVPILNIQDLLKSSVESEPSYSEGKDSEGTADEKKKSVLIVEDSITSRMLLKNILEGAGYCVDTAINGRDAYTKLKIQPFNAVVSDIEMPRMNGFELTKKIRNEKKFADIPIILVTSLESREDREKGIEVGANAYIVKKSFDHDYLLSVIERLL